MGARSGCWNPRTHPAFLGMGGAGRGHRQIPVARRRSQRAHRARRRIPHSPPLHRRGSDVHRTRQHHHLLAVRATRLRPRHERRGILRTLRLLARRSVTRPRPQRTIRRTQRHRHTIRQTRRRRATPVRAHPRRTRRDSAPRHARLRHRRGKDDPRVEHLTRENVRQSGEISGKTCRSHALSNRHGPRSFERRWWRDGSTPPFELQCSPNGRWCPT